MSHDCPTGSHRLPDFQCYAKHGCRCEGCIESKRHAHARWRERKRRQLEKVRAERPPLKPAPVLDYAAVPLLDLPWYEDRPAS